MNFRITTLSLGCAMFLAACGSESPPPAQDTTPTATAQDTTPPAATPATTMPPAAETPAPAAETPSPATQASPADSKPTAVVADCSTTIEGNDAIQFNVGSITVPSSCTEFTINMKHVGKMPVAAMGHNVVIALASDREAIARDGMAAGLEADFVKPDDDRVIAHSNMVGGGESTSVTFPVSELQGEGPYEFFCSFPGHWAFMRGTIQTG